MLALLIALPLLVTELCMLAISGLLHLRKLTLGLWSTRRTAHIEEYLWPDSRCGLQKAGQVGGRLFCAAVLHLLDRRCWPKTALCHLPPFHAVVTCEIHACPLGLHPADALDPDSHPRPDESAADEAPDEAEVWSWRAGFDTDACARSHDIKVGLQGGAWSVKRRGTAVSEVRADERPNARAPACCVVTRLPKSATFELNKFGERLAGATGRAVGAPRGLSGGPVGSNLIVAECFSPSALAAYEVPAEVADLEAQLTKAQAKRLRGIMGLLPKSCQKLTAALAYELVVSVFVDVGQMPAECGHAASAAERAPCSLFRSLHPHECPYAKNKKKKPSSRPAINRFFYRNMIFVVFAVSIHNRLSYCTMWVLFVFWENICKFGS